MVVPYLIAALCYFCHFVQPADNFAKCSTLNNYGDCSNKNFISIPNNIPKWINRLNMNNNFVRTLDSDSLKNISQVWELKINKNRIHSIEKDAFENMIHLKTLELNRNQLESVEALTFNSLENLVTLKIKRNKINSLGDGSFFKLKKIHSLYLDYNNIHIISKSWLYGLTSLREMYLSNNMIQNIDNDAWEFCKGLTKLDLSNNRLRSIKKDTFNELYNLEELILNNNNISIIEDDAFLHTPKLKTLNLSDNKISWTIEDANGVFHGLADLINLYIAANEIKSINRNAFIGLNNVNYLDLNKNNITSIQKDAFSDLVNLKKVVLNTTALICDCNLHWFYDYLIEKKFKVIAVCAYPNWLRHKPLHLVPNNNFSCEDLPKPRLIEEPDAEIIASKGDNISLVCKAKSTSPINMYFQWKKDNIELSNADTSVIPILNDPKTTEIMSLLNLTGVQHIDAGKYQCVVSNSYGTTYSKKSTISVLIRPTFKKIPSNITVQAGTTARLDCSATGEPQPEIAWQKDGGNDFPAARERRMEVMTDDDEFFIVNAKPSDMGVYSCTAHNAAGTIVANATLTIEEKPSVKPMEDKEVTQGESVVIKCMAGGAPKPTIVWLKDNVPIRATERHFLTAEDQLLIIVDTVVSDGGTYMCKLNNSLGVKTAQSNLVVKPVLVTDSDMFGIIIISVVCCAVFTSICWVVIIYQTRRVMIPPHSPTTSRIEPPTMLDFVDEQGHYAADNTSEHSSCKDSGTGESAKRSNDNLMPAEEYTLIINENCSGKMSTIRAASLVYLASDSPNTHVPLLYTEGASFSRSTNHDRPPEEVSDAETSPAPLTP